jgi:NTP pyrophosphatase (non-canonical NTP hydrolase)
MTDIIDVNQIKQVLGDFANERNWDQFHNPKNLAMALAGEAGELLEIFQWLSETDAATAGNNGDIKENTSLELADIIIYAIQLARKLNINLSDAIQRKIILNGKKYPVSASDLNK